MRRLLALTAIAATCALLLAGCSSNSGSPAPTPTATAGGSTAPANPYPAPSQTTSFSGEGSSFVGDLVRAWDLEYATVSGGKVHANYPDAPGGSGAGRTAVETKKTFYGASDAPLKAADHATYANLLQVPETIGPVAMMYNLANAPDGVKLTGEVLGKMFTGDIRSWDDPAITALGNSGMPHTDITIVYRSDSSGTSFAFTDYLTKASPTFHASTIANGTATSTPYWGGSKVPHDHQLSGKGSSAVANTVAASSCNGCIGYAELNYAVHSSVKMAAIQNKDGNAYLKPSTAGAAAAADSLASSLPAPDGDWSKVSLVNAPGANAYPITTFSYVMVWRHASDYAGGTVPGDAAQNQAAFKAWLWWGLHDGQEIAVGLSYAPLPASVVAIGENALSMMGP
jgi:phosphate ABC transporter phosphate-binding protein